MAELNFGLLNPPGSQNIGNAFVQGMDQAAVARAQENQNALAQYTLSKARREDEVNNRLLSDLRAAKTPEEQMQAYVYAGRAKDALAMQSDILKNIKTRNEILAQPGIQKKTELDNQEAKAKFFLSRLPTLSQNPDDAAIGRYLREAVDAGVMSFEEASAKSADLLSKSLPERRLQMLQGGQSAKDALAQLRPNIQEFSRGLYDVHKFDLATGMPQFLSPRVAPPSTDAAIRSANAAGMKWNPETLQFENVGGGVPAQPGAAPAPVTPAAAPAPVGAPVTPAAFPRITPQVQATRNAQQIAILNAELVNSNPADQQRIRAEIAKLSTGNPFAAAGANPSPVVNNMPGAVAVNAMNAPPAQPPSPRMLRDMALKGMQPDGKGGWAFIPGGPADPVVKQQVSTAQAVGAQTGKSNAIALEKLPNAIATGKELIRKLDEILGDANVVEGKVMYNKAPAAGFDSAFGPTGIIARAYPSSEAAAFQARVKEILGGAFLEAYETLRGAQGITDIEGKKATESRTRMGFNLSKTEFIIAAREYRKTAAEALKRSETRLNSLQGSAAPAQTDQAALDWAAANPSDPRAAQIQQRNGVR